jgi:protein phosphatase
MSKASLRVIAAGDTDIGAREHNEDTVMLRPDLDLYMLADGAGGQNAGNVASALACTTIAHYFEASLPLAMTQPEFDELGLSTAARRLATSIQAANRAVMDVAKSSHKYRGMGSTIVAVYVQPERGLIHIAHVGDSRCYRVRDGQIELLTHDHTLVNDVLALRPDMPDEQLARLPRNVITRALGMSESVRVSVRSWNLRAGDRYALCSDGVSDELYDSQIEDALMTEKTAEDQARLLLQLAGGAAADDNLGAVVIACDLTPGMKTFKRARPAARPPRSRRAGSESPAPADDDDYPEIIVVGEGPTEESVPEIHVVPARSAKPDLIDAISELMGEPARGWMAPARKVGGPPDEK